MFNTLMPHKIKVTVLEGVTPPPRCCVEEDNQVIHTGFPVVYFPKNISLIH